MQALKIVIIGGGSTYTPELIDGLLQGIIPIREIVLMDIDEYKLQVVGGLAQRMAQQATPHIPITLTTGRSSALDGADVVVTQLRVGGLAARIEDERIPLQHHIVGQETTGPGGFFNALRTIPVILDINHEMGVRCPDAWLINFTNPSGIMAEALHLHGRGKFVGLCNYPLTLKMHLAAALDVDEERITLGYFGLNHLSWTRVAVDGIDRTDDVIDTMINDPTHRELSGYAFDTDCLRRLGLIPSGYLRYFYDTEKMVSALRAASQTRGERVRDIEVNLLREYADPELASKPAGLQERGGAWYATAAVRLLGDIFNEKGNIHVLNVVNQHAVSFLPAEVVVETPAYVVAGTITPLPTVGEEAGESVLLGQVIPPDVVELTRQVKDYELRAVEAAVSGSREAAITALAHHPLFSGKTKEIPALVAELLAAHRGHLPQFFTRK